MNIPMTLLQVWQFKLFAPPLPLYHSRDEGDTTQSLKTEYTEYTARKQGPEATRLRCDTIVTKWTIPAPTTASLLFIWLMREYDIGIEYIDGLVVRKQGHTSAAGDSWKWAWRFQLAASRSPARPE
ncbi:hypothetical protein B0H14DRAFT_2623119 [Mycena olivaceomarginata]|nr:hypothetical protein B0H14DRAFT_2623119 [Mycena olivaceomarginata]